MGQDFLYKRWPPHCLRWEGTEFRLLSESVSPRIEFLFLKYSFCSLLQSEINFGLDSASTFCVPLSILGTKYPHVGLP